MDFGELEPSTNLLRRFAQVGLFIVTALIAGVGFAFLADSNGGNGEVRMKAVTEVPYTAHLDVAPRADRLPKSQQAAPVTELEPGEDAAFAELVERALAETDVAKAPTVVPTNDFGPAGDAPIPVARPEPPHPAIARYDEPTYHQPTYDDPKPTYDEPTYDDPTGADLTDADPSYGEPGDVLLPMEPIPERDYSGAEFDAYDAPDAPRGRERALDALGLPFELVGRTVATLGNAVASIGRPARRY